MTEKDRVRWDEVYTGSGPAQLAAVGLPSVFAGFEDLFPTAGHALDLACGQGLAAVWLARRGLDVHGFDVSPVAIRHARDLARRGGVGDRCRFDVVDLDQGLPDGPAADVVVCHRFRDRRLDRVIIRRLAPDGLLAISALSEVGGTPGPFRAAPGELTSAFAELELIAADEADGVAWVLARR
ncbi:SAM-dependent methyltransferase [Mycobacterium branderi]|uniref:SAM-dependent methyltransferase n=1 Tax=Mycobacterium branderi TaxID=43348 RepID=A0A7I7W8A4_9MYCO|nr:class I SAM-dependent methyltransferase [Mycobacterium branderi]MCV7234082.1 class I SAM-dependent methyltransferase [Mycobacterium branderi]ORA32210.1 SAM-dependent methyltransferase [Mycobacterium branderi]BBZ13836.1 SAM-dependent methyltransferase [Mycobacterium branderi]